ncbi:MAG: nucleoside phosphorylase [Rhodospirillales bacterium]
MAKETEPSLVPPILDHKQHDEPSVFRPENLLREARRQKGLPRQNVPPICVLDPDGDIVRHLCKTGGAKPVPHWACYHSTLFSFEREGITFGIVGCGVGASYAVLIAEQLFVSGCRFLVSMTSSGQIQGKGPTPYFVLIDKALRDEGTSYHYLPPSDYSEADAELIETIDESVSRLDLAVHRGSTWTTDAPFRETGSAIERHRQEGILAVEMEAAALYAFARVRGKPVVCFAHVTNQMARDSGDFEKGDNDGTTDALKVILAAARGWRRRTETA